MVASRKVGWFPALYGADPAVLQRQRGRYAAALVVDAALQRLIHAEHALGVLNVHVLHHFLVGQLLKGLVGQGVLTAHSCGTPTVSR